MKFIEHIILTVNARIAFAFQQNSLTILTFLQKV